MRSSLLASYPEIMDKGQPFTIMVVDQHAQVCASLARSLKRLPGVTVQSHTTNLALAAELAHMSSPDVIIMDLTWGQVARPEMLRWFGRVSPRSRLVVYSSYYKDGERDAFQEAGASRCLLKGMSIKDLVVELRKVLESTAEKPASAGRR